MPLVNIVVPCYNEEEVLPETARQLSALLDRLVTARQVDPGSGVWFVDDGSRDRTWVIIAGLHDSQPQRFHGIKLSRNQGHQNALVAGLWNAPGDALISIDADLQDDIEAIPKMVARFHEGYDIVYGVRIRRDMDTAFKRRTAQTYYSLLKGLGVEIVHDHADYRLMSRRAVEALKRYSEVNLFLRAIIPRLGFRAAEVAYERKARFAGTSKYPVGRMIALAVNGITSFSMGPLRLITVTGFVMAVVSFLIGLWAICLALFTSRVVPGWASIVVPITLVGGVQMLSMGAIGEYIGKIFLEVKRRPLFEIEELL